ncbi:16S rRNA (guanine(527)-N(7))-methyltransferase RsmG [Parvularcula lutaonensis]|uniref:Ribosomal RNA small subunit methyltransferase G n=1 Tax=Parvularcula lutaonensis TaxID=491923 RepID=A0ABV7M948_9PROT|nr:16S rRNA (guanine(527)-N(7))-methyltransferase RsmG [Parvularcula lutaonensis]GGY46442.1 ribosomal RNA small subunit methyltransferase G [Parvularcula lutaonensis]
MSLDSAEAFFAHIDASPEERARFRAYDAELIETAAHTNIVARGSLPERWERHYADSAQLWALLPNSARRLLDFGSGAGFPGMVLAILAADRVPALRLSLCDSVGKKAAFLQRVIERTGLRNVIVSNRRVENFPEHDRFDTITARAVTALPGLLDFAVPRLAEGGTMIFPKGQRAQQEVDEARERWSFDLESMASQTDPDARILLIRDPKRK